MFILDYTHCNKSHICSKHWSDWTNLGKRQVCLNYLKNLGAEFLLSDIVGL